MWPQRPHGLALLIFRVNLIGSGEMRSQHTGDSPADFLNGANPVDAAEFLLLLVEPGNWQGFLIINADSLAGRFLIIVGTAAFLATEHEAGNQFFLRHFEGNHAGDGGVVVGKQGIKRFGLGHSSGEAIENKAIGTLVGFQPFFDQLNDDLVAHQLPRIHDGLNPLAQLRAGGPLGPEHVAGREVNQAEFVDDLLRLGAFTCPGRAKKYNVQHKKWKLGSPGMGIGEGKIMIIRMSGKRIMFP